MSQFVLTENTKLQDLPITDNFMFQQVMKNEVICKQFLEKVLKIKIVKLDYVALEKTFEHFPDSKGIRLDLYVEDSEHRIYDIEMQTGNRSNNWLEKRTRYYQSSLDVQTFIKGEDYDKLKTTYIIFVCDFDPFGEGRRIYTFKNFCVENKDLELKDGTTKIFLNSKGTIGDMDEDIVDFLEYLNGGVPKSGLTKSIDNEVTVVKSRKELEAEFMTYRSGFMDARVIGRAEGEAIGEARGRAVSAIGMIKDKMPLNLIAKYTQLTIEQIQEIAKSIGVAVVI